jgi:hypothetical protein
MSTIVFTIACIEEHKILIKAQGILPLANMESYLQPSLLHICLGDVQVRKGIGRIYSLTLHLDKVPSDRNTTGAHAHRLDAESRTTSRKGLHFCQVHATKLACQQVRRSYRTERRNSPAHHGELWAEQSHARRPAQTLVGRIRRSSPQSLSSSEQLEAAHLDSDQGCFR